MAARSDTAVAAAGPAPSSEQGTPPAAGSELAPAPSRHPFRGKAQEVPLPPALVASEPDEPNAEDLDAEPDPDLLTDPDAEPDDQGEGDEDETPEDDTPATAMDAGQWAQALWDSPQRINEVPAKLRADVLARQKSIYDAAARQAYELGQRHATEAAQFQAAVTEIDNLAEDDPAAFRDWQRQYPDRASAYAQHKAQGSRPADTGGALAIQATERSLAAKLDAIPGAREKFLELRNANPSRFSPTPEGIANLSEAVADVLAELKATQRMAKEKPAEDAAAKRQEAANGRKGLPKSVAAPSLAPLSAITPEWLQKATQAEVDEVWDRPGGQEALNKAERDLQKLAARS